jgi:hypothetical protein
LGGLALGGGGALLALANNVGRATATPVPSSTVPPELTATSPATTPRGQILADDFSDPASGFGIPPEDPSGGVAYSAGALRFTILKQGVEWFSTSGRVKAQDVAIHVGAQQTAGPAKTEFGAVCRWRDQDNYTAFAISAQGQYRIWQKSHGSTLGLVDWTAAPSLAGPVAARRQLSATCVGTQLRLTVDGVELGKANDPNPAAGDVALFAGLRETGRMVVDFRNFVVRRP